MSLSFVSSAVQIGTSDGGFEEKPIENKETEAVNRRNAHKPLFEQLRSNQEQDQEKKEEQERLLMRSTCALDEDDVAHLNAIERQRSDRERKIQERTENELKEFRAARVLKKQAALSGEDKDDENDESNAEDQAAKIFIMNGNASEALAEKRETNPGQAGCSLPVIKVRKRKRRTNPLDTQSKQTNIAKGEASKLEKGYTSDLNEVNPSSEKRVEMSSADVKRDESAGGLGSLLSGYGSSSDED